MVVSRSNHSNTSWAPANNCSSLPARGTTEGTLAPGTSPSPKGSIRMAVHRRMGGGGGLPLPGPRTKVTIAGKNEIFQNGKSGWAIFGAQTFGSQTPPSLEEGLRLGPSQSGVMCYNP